MGLGYRIVVMCVNIIFPPAAVMMVAGAGFDTIMNCLLFLAAVIPSHIHGFYITLTYFSRRSKVKKARYPGGPKSLIHSENVINGGASDAEVNRLWRDERGISGKSKLGVGRGKSEMAESTSPKNGYVKSNGYSKSSSKGSRGYRR